MLIRSVRPSEKDKYNKVVTHPLQSWQWGEFRKATGLKVERVGTFFGGKIQKGLQVTFHKIPIIGMKAGYFAKGYMPDETQLSILKQLAKTHNALFIKLEPHVEQKIDTPSAHKVIGQFLLDNDAVPGKPFFFRYTYLINLKKSEKELFAKLASKTRYNVNLAYKKGVKIVEDTTQEGMEKYIQILEETTKRQSFYAHSPEYFRTMWKTLGDSGMLRIFHAVYDNQVLVSWVMFVFNNTLYYPYGSSRRVHRDVMASNLMMWEMIRFGKTIGCTKFDLWGCLGPNPSKKHSWYGFHRFKKGYGGDLVESLGTYDAVYNQPMYKVFGIAENARWKWLKLRARLRR